MVEHKCYCGCAVYQAPLPPVVAGVEYVEQPIDVLRFVGCARHADWVEAEAESYAWNAAGIRLAREGVTLRDVRWDGRLVVVADSAPDGLSDRLNATEPEQDWRHPCIPEDVRDRFHGLVVAALLACRLEAP